MNTEEEYIEIDKCIIDDAIWFNAMHVSVFIDLCLRMNGKGYFDGKISPSGEVFDNSYTPKEEKEYLKSFRWLRRKGYIKATAHTKPFRVKGWYKVELTDLGKKFVTIPKSNK